jgi:hypothetical protein
MGNVLPDRICSMNVFVYKTSVETEEHVMCLSPKLNALAGPGSWNFDLADCDRILRIVSNNIKAKEAVLLLRNFGFSCSELED